MISVIMGSISDREVGEKVTKILNEFGIEYDLKVISAHRSHDLLVKYCDTFEEKNVEVVIAIAGKSAHLAGVIAGLVTQPVIAIPVKTSFMGGLDSMLSIIQMPSGIPVAAVGVNAGENAALLAIQILSVSRDDLKQKLKEYKIKLEKSVEKMQLELQNGEI